MQEQTYKTFRTSIQTTTLLDDFAPILIDDISQKSQEVFQLKKDFCKQLTSNCSELQSFPEFLELSNTLLNHLEKLKDDFYDCEENIGYFTLVFMGAVSAGKTSMICDFLNVNPDQLNEALQASSDFQEGDDDVVIAGEVATANVYEFLVESSRIRLVDVPGTGGVVHDNTTLAPFVNKADCVIFLSNAQSDLTRDDYDFVVRHIVGLQDASELTPDNASSKKALIVVNKWQTVAQNLPPNRQEKEWLRKRDWILFGGSKKGENDSFKGLSDLFKRTLAIVPATTSQRVLDDDGKYEQYGKTKLDEVIDTLKDILIEEGIQIKLERPKIILKHSLSKTQEILENERTKQSVDELVSILEQMGVKVAIDSNSIMMLLGSRVDKLGHRLKNDLFYQINTAISSWKPNVSVINRIKGLWPKEWWGSERFGAKAVQEELKERWKSELEDLLNENIKPEEIRRTVRDEADSIGQLLEKTFKAQIAEIQNEVLKEKISKGASIQAFDEKSINPVNSGKTLEDAVNKATLEIQRSIIDDIIGIITIDAIIATLIGTFLTPLGSALFLAVRRWLSGQAEEKKAKRNIEDEIWRIADEVSGDLKEQVSKKLRSSVQESINSITHFIEGERESLSKPIQAIDAAIMTVHEARERLDAMPK
ncbi:MAG: hypothetical protein F6K31_12240 [Symploca sp. SIO2G7]|nr:hypothetical protein [Symploca sp. SIO2G7]